MSNCKFSFRLPADEKAIWLEKLGLIDFPKTISKYARIYVIHFEGEAFEVKPSRHIFL